MATLRVNGTGYLVMSNKVTTPSIIIQGIGYIPLFQSNSNTIDYLRYRYTLGNLRVGNYRAATSRAFINHNPSVSISAVSGASGAGPISVHNGTTVRLQAYGADPDGDSLSYRWSNGSTDSTIYINSNNTTQYYNCTVRDPYGGSATSNTIQITWYNRAPSVSIGASGTNVINGTTVWLTAYASDPDGDRLSYKWNTGSTASQITVNASDTTRSYYCTVTDPYGGSATSNHISVRWYNNSWKFRARIEHTYVSSESSSSYGSSGGGYAFYAHITSTQSVPSSYPYSDVWASPGRITHYGEYGNASKYGVSEGRYGGRNCTIYCMNYGGYKTIHWTTKEPADPYGHSYRDKDHSDSFHAFGLIKTEDKYITDTENSFEISA